MARIYTPVKGYSGVSASVTFTNGVGETSDVRLLEWFQKHGYQVEEEKQPKEKNDAAKDNAAEEPAEDMAAEEPAAEEPAVEEESPDEKESVKKPVKKTNRGK